MNRRYYLIVESEYITSFKDKETLLNALWLMTGKEELRNSDEIFEPLLLLRKKRGFTDVTLSLQECLSWIDFFADNYQLKAEMLEELLLSITSEE
ncbi:MAG: hypothetical protein ACI4NC_04455 [Succinivibrio sp.]